MYRFAVCCVLLSIHLTSSLDWRVVGGQNAVEGQFPYQISIRVRDTHICGGTIINNKWIITAAHCIDGRSPTSLSIAAGTIILDDPDARVYTVNATIVHDNWGTENNAYDIGLIRLSEDIEFNEYIQPLPLNTEDIGTGETVTLSGWGLTSSPGSLPKILQWINLASLSVDECRIKMHNLVGDKEICTFTKKGEGACTGDSGGPLMYNRKLAGIVSWGWPCALGYPDVFTRVSMYIDWIQERII